LREAVKILLEAGKVFVTAAGTSYYASEHFAYVVMKLTGRSVIPLIASEYELYENTAREGDVLVAVSQSGETIDVLKAVRAFKKKRVKVLSVSNVVDSAIPRESNVTIYTRAGPEIGVAATKTFLAQSLVLSWLACDLALAFGSIDRREHREITSTLEKASSLVDSTLRELNKMINDLSEKLLQVKSMYYLSRGVGLPVAREGALKIKEIAYVHAEAYPAGESKHGPIALVEDGFPVVFVVPHDDSIERKILGNVEEMKARGALTIGILYRNSNLKDAVDIALEVPAVHWVSTPLTHTPPLQLLAYYLAVRRGYDPDKPRNLAKTVTVE
jgi:glucosamine--fructose-6-phosphate aminotransferase (isomerizing)